jgi:hypothetical protein
MILAVPEAVRKLRRNEHKSGLSFLGNKTACLTSELFHNVAPIYAVNNM